MAKPASLNMGTRAWGMYLRLNLGHQLTQEKAVVGEGEEEVWR